MQRFFTVLLTCYLLIGQPSTALGAGTAKIHEPPTKHTYDTSKLLVVPSSANTNVRDIPAAVLNNVLLPMAKLGIAPSETTKTIAINHRLIPALLPCRVVASLREALYQLCNNAKIENRIKLKASRQSHYEIANGYYNQSAEVDYETCVPDKFNIVESTQTIGKRPQCSFLLFFLLGELNPTNASQVYQPIKAHISSIYKPMLDALTPEQRQFICDLFDSQYFILNRRTRPKKNSQEYGRTEDTVIQLTADQERILHSLDPEIQKNLYLNYCLEVTSKSVQQRKQYMIDLYPKELSAAVDTTIKEKLSQAEKERLAQLSINQLKLVVILAPNFDPDPERHRTGYLWIIELRGSEEPALFDTLPQDVQQNLNRCYKIFRPILINSYATPSFSLRQFLFHWDREKVVRVAKIATATLGVCYCLRRTWQNPHVRTYLKIPQR